jgi:hypothetical protein
MSAAANKSCCNFIKRLFSVRRRHACMPGNRKRTFVRSTVMMMMMLVCTVIHLDTAAVISMQQMEPALSAAAAHSRRRTLDHQMIRCRESSRNQSSSHAPTSQPLLLPTLGSFVICCSLLFRLILQGGLVPRCCWRGRNRTLKTNRWL